MRWAIAMFPKSLRRLLILTVAIVAVLEWSVVLDRVCAALWAWYKFVGYGGGGHVVVGRNTQEAFFLLSVLLATVGYFLSKAEMGSSSRVWSSVAQLGWLAIVVCVIFWGAFLATPFISFHP
jgi:hypothetical protein